MGNLVRDQLLTIFSVKHVILFFFFTLPVKMTFQLIHIALISISADQLIIFKCYLLFVASPNSLLLLLLMLLNMHWILQY